MTDPITPAEVAANLLGAKGVTCLVCAWLDEDGDWTWYKIGSPFTLTGLLEILKMQSMDDCVGEEDDDEE